MPARRTNNPGRPEGENGRNSFWMRTFEVARRNGGQWHRVSRYYTQSSAAQLASDISNAHHRDRSTVRVKGILDGEIWEARWAQAPDGPNGDHVVWLRLLPTVSDRG